MGSRRTRAAGSAVRLFVLVVLFALFALHVLTAHGSSQHHVLPTLSAAPSHSAPHGGSHLADFAQAHEAASADPGSSVSQPIPALGGSVSMSAPAPVTGSDLLMCWLLLSAGLILVIGLLRFTRAAADTAGGSPGMSCPERAPRAPPGRQRLHQLTILQV